MSLLLIFIHKTIRDGRGTSRSDDGRIYLCDNNKTTRRSHLMEQITNGKYSGRSHGGRSGEGRRRSRGGRGRSRGLGGDSRLNQGRRQHESDRGDGEEPELEGCLHGQLLGYLLQNGEERNGSNLCNGEERELLDEV